MIHIGIDARLNYYRVGGISTYTRHLVAALEKLDTQNHYTVFRSRKTRDSVANHFGSAPLWTPCHHRNERLALSVELARFNLDVLHSPDFIPPMRGAKHHVITVHDLAFLLYPEFMTDESRRYYNDQIQAAVDHADYILSVSESTCHDLMRLLHVPREKITVQLEGVDPKFRTLPLETLAAYREKLKLPQTFFLFVSTLEPRKNIQGLLDGYSVLRSRMRDVPPLIMYGNRGWQFDERILAGRAGVEWRGPIDHDDLPAVYNIALALVTPSFYEGFGLPALEAMACGTVPIVSNRSSFPEVVGDVGIQVNPDDPAALANALDKVLLDDTWRESMEQQAVTRAAQFTWERAAQVALDVYQKVVH